MKPYLKAITDALNNGTITPDDAINMRQNLGVSQAYFTRKQIPKSKIKTKRKLQKLARKTQRNK